MQTNKTKKVPRLRFSGFGGEWEVAPLKTLAKIGTGNKDTQNKVKDGAYPFYVRSDTVERINSYSYDGVAILTSGDGVGVGKNFHYVDGKFDYHQRVYAIRDFKDSVNNKYIYQYFTEKFYKRVMRVSAKNSVDSVRMEMIADMPIPVPSIDEQNKIAGFLGVVDDRIGAIDAKVELLKKYKKAIMQKIFPPSQSYGGQAPQIRFKNENDKDYPDWEEKRLGKTILDSKLSTKVENEYPVMTSSRKGIVLQRDYYGADNRITDRDNIGYNILPPNYITYRSRSDDGLFKFNLNTTGITGIVSYFYPVFSIKNGSVKFMMELLNFNWKFLYKYSVGTSQKVLAHSELKKIKIAVPCESEQQKIADFLTSIDDKIKAEEKRLHQAKTFKKSLLQRMFI